MATRWLEISIRASAEAAEALTPVFEKNGHGGVVVEPEMGPQMDDTDALVPSHGRFSSLKTYVPDGTDVDVRLRTIAQAVDVLRAFDLAPMDALETRWIDEEDWANAWKQHYSVLRIGRRWVVKPRWQEYAPGPGDRVLELDPGMAFGTGQHPTTQLVLEALESLDDAGEVCGRRVLDLGTGSGVLAIAAARAGAQSVLALDAEEIAARVATENVVHNAVNGIVDVRHATLGKPIDGVSRVPGVTYDAAFDGAFANIVARVIAERAPALGRAVRPGGWMIASGVIAEREDEATDALARHGFVVEQRDVRGDWVALRCRRGGAK